MSWKDDIGNDFIIQTGDNVRYKVFANKYSKSVSWNHDVFSFIGIKGQLGKKEEQLARQFPLEFYFQGEDHLEESKRFENSLNSKEPCLISHPLYGNIYCHIFSVTFSNSDTELNVTKITGTALETLIEGGLLETSPISAITLSQKSILDTAPAEIIDMPVTVADSVQLKNSAAVDKANGLKIITIPDEATQYTNVFNEAITAVNVLTASPVLAMGAMCNFISMPANFTALVGDRFNFLEAQFERLLATVVGYVVNPAQKKIFEIQAATCVSAMCVAAITPIGREYKTTKDVLSIAKKLSARFNTLVETLDSLQVSNGGINEYYIFSADLFFSLGYCVHLTLSNLILIALNGTQERFVYTTEDTNAIILAHRYYGADINDDNLQYFIDTNNFTYQQMIFIKKGTKIVYYA
jgi:hypothetical protein